MLELLVNHSTASSGTCTVVYVCHEFFLVLECSLYSLVDQQATTVNSTVHHVTLQKQEASTYSTNDQLLLKLFNYERCIYLPVCTEIITRIIVLDWIGLHGI